MTFEFTHWRPNTALEPTPINREQAATAPSAVAALWRDK
jgi:hypothetical protein